MELQFYKQIQGKDESDNPVLIWQFVDNIGNYYCTQTDVNSDEITAKAKFESIDSPLGLS